MKKATTTEMSLAGSRKQPSVLGVLARSLIKKAYIRIILDMSLMESKALDPLAAALLRISHLGILNEVFLPSIQYASLVVKNQESLLISVLLRLQVRGDAHGALKPTT